MSKDLSNEILNECKEMIELHQYHMEDYMERSDDHRDEMNKWIEKYNKEAKALGLEEY